MQGMLGRRMQGPGLAAGMDLVAQKSGRVGGRLSWFRPTSHEPRATSYESRATKATIVPHGLRTRGGMNEISVTLPPGKLRLKVCCTAPQRGRFREFNGGTLAAPWSVLAVPWRYLRRPPATPDWADSTAF